jgi:hypothetical protein
MTHLVSALPHARCHDRGSGIGALPVPRLPSGPLRGAGASADGCSPYRAAEHGPPTVYLPCVGQLDLPSDDVATTAVSIEDEQAAAAAAARPQPDPNLDFLGRVLRGLRKL